MARNEPRSAVKAVETTLAIIDALQEHRSATIDELADAVGVGSSTVHRHLVTLRREGYVISEDGEYRLGMKFLTHAGQIRTQIPCNELISRKVRQLGRETEERVQFIVEEHGDRVYVFTYAGQNAVRTDASIGKRGPLHVSASGKSILAALPDDRVDEILSEKPLEAITSNSITSRETLEGELEEVRERGYAFNDEESISGLRAIAVPVTYGDDVLGALSVSGPANRLTGEYFREELPDLLLGTVNEIELNLEYS